MSCDRHTQQGGGQLSGELGVFRLGLFENRKLGVGILPQLEEVLKCLLGLHGVARERIGPREAQLGWRVVQSPVGVDPCSAPTGALVIHDFLELAYCLRAFVKPQICQSTEVIRLDIGTFVRSCRGEQRHTCSRLISIERSYRSNFRKLYFVPDGTVWKELGSLRGELLRMGRVTA